MSEIERAPCGPRRPNRFWFLATLLVVAGLALVGENYHILPDVHRMWPIFPTILGFGFLALGFRHQRHEATLIALGAMFIGLSALFFCCIIIGWGILTELWPSFIGILGIAFLSGSPWAAERYILAMVGGVLIVLSAIFLLVVTVDTRLWPLSFVVLGASLYLIGRSPHEPSGGALR